MTDAVAIALVTALPPTIVAFAGLIVSLRNSKKADDNGRKADEIHVLVNSRMDHVRQELESAKAEIKVLTAALK